MTPVRRSARRRLFPARGASLALGLALVASLAGCQERRPPAFDEKRAFEDLATQVVPGTPAHERCRDWLVARFKAAGAVPIVQAFPDTVYGQAYTFSNVRARFGPASGTWIVIGAHWDTRPFADQDPDTTKRGTPIPGANDGASGVAVLLELARDFQSSPPPVGVELVCFDGEDLGKASDVQGFCRGSRYYAKALAHPLPALAVVLDMVGDKDLDLYYESNSQQAAPNLVARLWAGAASVGAKGFAAALQRVRRSHAVPRGRHPRDRRDRLRLPGMAHHEGRSRARVRGQPRPGRTHHAPVRLHERVGRVGRALSRRRRPGTAENRPCANPSRGVGSRGEWCRPATLLF